MPNLQCPRDKITIRGTSATITSRPDFRMQCIGANCADYPCSAVSEFVVQHCDRALRDLAAAAGEILSVPQHKITVVGDPMTMQDFGQLMNDLYKAGPDGRPLWKKLFGVTDDGGGNHNGKNQPE